MDHKIPMVNHWNCHIYRVCSTATAWNDVVKARDLTNWCQHKPCQIPKTCGLFLWSFYGCYFYGDIILWIIIPILWWSCCFRQLKS